ncbi:MAG TPA: DUF5317 family protein [Candidatus Limnocylindria bacterium]|nr:DUF5317 family protein [Candidatus Limnocylindria bacterium]
MFMLWAIPIGISIGLLVDGRLSSLSTFRFRWGWLAVAGLLVQVVLFTETGDRLAGPWGEAIYVASTLAVFLAVLRNIRVPGMALVALGALSNLAAIGANGGAMPADPAALAAAGLDGPGRHTNSVVLADPALRLLTDIFAIPAWLPFANVFSVGDVLIGVGIVIVIVAAMRRPLPGGAPPEPAEPAVTNEA